MTDAVERARRDVVIANRILAAEGVLDAFGHVSARHPLDKNLFFMAQSVSPELVEIDDIMTFDAQGNPVDDRRHASVERFIHAGVYARRPDVNFVVHGHTDEVIPFSITDVALVPVINVAADITAHIPTWDIADEFGDNTNTLISSMAHGLSLAQTLADHRVVLMRGHGFTAASSSIVQLVRLCVYLPRNARIQLEAMRLGEFRPLKAGEIARLGEIDPDSPASQRSWRYWARKCGCESLLENAGAPGRPAFSAS
ncbi:class II aldolase/adducin family protein [Roseiarcaceae bacterium H3SJ34-1]|uniref:class II aldolase/adducin family protein n=1 Tax=Terripilifer ovatus TaxID=3032367 RepID=UPI003AB96792|nr:class II aldolase/adducin family protein [Roseiarcaceae bacterium H3SJ34-1]